MDDKAHPVRNSFRFSLRTYFIVLTVFLMWLGHNLQRAARQRDACERVKQLDTHVDGYITYSADWDMEAPGIPRRLNRSAVNCFWRSLIGDDFMQPVAFIAAPGATDDLSFLQSFPELKALTLERSAVTDETMKQITHLQRLRYL